MTPNYRARPVYSLDSMQMKDYAFYIMIMIIVLLCGFVAYKVYDGSVSCIASPIQYGIKNMKATGDAPITCTCSALGVKEQLVYTADNITKSNMGGINIQWEKS